MTIPDPATPTPPAMPPEPATRPRVADGPRYGSIIVGLVILGIGIWYFADRTLGLELPRIEADQLWPLAVIALGAWLVIRPSR